MNPFVLAAEECPPVLATGCRTQGLGEFLFFIMIAGCVGVKFSICHLRFRTLGSDFGECARRVAGLGVFFSFFPTFFFFP